MDIFYWNQKQSIFADSFVTVEVSQYFELFGGNWMKQSIDCIKGFFD